MAHIYIVLYIVWILRRLKHTNSMYVLFLCWGPLKLGLSEGVNVSALNTQSRMLILCKFFFVLHILFGGRFVFTFYDYVVECVCV